MPDSSSVFRFILLCCVLLFACGCSTVNAPDKRDPWEDLNRDIFLFNEDLDNFIGRPVAQAYQDYLPSGLQTGISNFFSNADDIVVAFNDLLQFKLKHFSEDLMRFSANTLIGIGGIFDVATDMGLPKRNEDFGQTLAVWGVGDGPYMVLPLLGPSTARDSVGILVDATIDPILFTSDNEFRWGLVTLRLIDRRAELLTATELVELSGIDPYIFTRNAYFQARRNLIFDGNPPPSDDEIPSTAPTQEELELELELQKELQQLDQGGNSQ